MRILQAAAIFLACLNCACFEPMGSLTDNASGSGGLEASGVGSTTVDDSTEGASSSSGPSCGDDVVQAPEECDGNVPPNDACSPTCAKLYRHAFVTANLFTGDLGGPAGADAKCQAEADAVGLPGQYRAWLSADSSPSTEFLHSFVPYMGPNWGPIPKKVYASDWSDLTDGMLTGAINITSAAGPAPMSVHDCPDPVAIVWTGTGTQGSPAGSSCDGWNSADSRALGTVGTPFGQDSTWTQYCTTRCDFKAALYCFEQ